MDLVKLHLIKKFSLFYEKIILVPSRLVSTNMLLKYDMYLHVGNKFLDQLLYEEIGVLFYVNVGRKFSFILLALLILVFGSCIYMYTTVLQSSVHLRLNICHKIYDKAYLQSVKVLLGSDVRCHHRFLQYWISCLNLCSIPSFRSLSWL